MGHFPLLPRQADKLQKFRDPALRRLALAQYKANVLTDTEVGKHGIVLKDHPDATPLRRLVTIIIGHDPAVNFNGPAVQSLKSGDKPQGGRLAATTWADKHQDIPGGNDE
jgi:hypothetical protein